MSEKKRRAAPPIRSDYAAGADFLRVISIFLIAWFHIWQQSWQNPSFTLFGHYFDLQTLVSKSYAMVDIMLMLSGFLLMLGHMAGRNRRPADFFRARVARIVPCYLLCVLVVLFADAIPNGLYGSARHMTLDVLSHLTFTHSLVKEGYIYTRLNGALWTLSVEVQFYALFPLLGRAFERRPYATYAGMTLLGLVCHAATRLCFAETSMLNNQLPNMLDAYANGMLAAVIYKRIADRGISKRGRILATVVCAAAAVGMYYCVCAQAWFRGEGSEALRWQQLVWRYPLTICGSAFVTAASLSLAGVRAAMSNRLIRFLAGISFNFYMWHQYLAVWLKKWRIPAYTGDQPNVDGQQPWQNRYTLICFGAALLTAILLTYLVEKPCGRWIRSRRNPQKRSEKQIESRTRA